VTDVRLVDQLERALRDDEPDRLQPARLAEIRTQGLRRRRSRRTVWAVGAAAAVVGLSALAGGVTGAFTEADKGTDRAPVATRDTPEELSPLAARVLAEVPGAVQVSAWQVLIPAPAGASSGGGDRIPADHIEAGPVDIGTRDYVGVTSFRERDFPAWLYDGVADYEQNVLGDEDGYPVGSTDIGIVVDAGPQRLACMTSLPEWGGERSDGCFPAMVSGADGDLSFAWGMGTDGFLQPGEDLELFSSETFVSGSAATVWRGGTDGTDVASVDLVTTDGTRVQATVAAGTLVPDETMFWGTVTGELALAVTRDADGDVLERHELEPCSDPVDCEVR
jgi:hypothetical protein